MFIKPATYRVDGRPALLTVRDPDTMKPLAEDGERKPDSQYWLRRRREGDVVDAEEPKKPAAAKATKKSEG